MIEVAAWDEVMCHLMLDYPNKTQRHVSTLWRWKNKNFRWPRDYLLFAVVWCHFLVPSTPPHCPCCSVLEWSCPACYPKCRWQLHLWSHTVFTRCEKLEILHQFNVSNSACSHSYWSALDCGTEKSDFSAADFTSNPRSNVSLWAALCSVHSHSIALLIYIPVEENIFVAPDLWCF